MRKHIELLSKVSQQPSRIVVGLMSGTSLDGLDIALCKINGHGKQTDIELLAFTTVNYSTAIKEQILSVFAKSSVDLQSLTLLHAEIGSLHATMIMQTLREWDVQAHDIDAIASHGQTIFHAPRSLHGDSAKPNATLQIGDGDHIAKYTGIITVSDFRQKHIAHGGEGAPLVVYGDYLMLSSTTANRCLLNIGGIANITVLPANANFEQVWCSDLGPGNTLIDAYTRQMFKLPYDHDANIARTGKVNNALLETLMQHPYFSKSLPKSTGPESFNLDYLGECMWEANCTKIRAEDVLATLTKFTATCLAETINQLPSDSEIYVSGGGAHNPLIMQYLSEMCTSKIVGTTDQLGVPSDAKEAILFALLANETLAGNEQTFSPGSAMAPNISMGKISFPD